MSRTRLPIVLLALFVVPLLLNTLTSPPVRASSIPATLDVKVDHIVQIRNGGLLVINDTVKLSATQAEAIELQNYTLGFPYQYQSTLDYAFAYETSEPNSTLKLELDTGMGVIGFYGVNVVFPQSVNISNTTQYEFNVVFVFSRRISANSYQVGNETMNLYNASFPAYPSLSQRASQANLTIIIPTGFNRSSSFEEKGISFAVATVGSKQYLNYVMSNLSEFSDENGWLEFGGLAGTFDIFEVSEVKRDIELSGMHEIIGSDHYRMTSKADKLVKLNIKLPKGAFDTSAYDELGPISTSNIEQKSTYTNLTISFAVPYYKDKETQFSVHYKLPWGNYTHTETWNTFESSVTLSEATDWTVRKLTTSVTLPEGATLMSWPSDLDSLQDTAFSTSFSLVFQNVTPFKAFSLDFEFQRAIFWESFRPTVWMGSAVAIISAIVGAWSIYKPPVTPIPTAITHVRVEDLKKFVGSYDEKRHSQSEIESLEVQARKGKIPRRLYKVRRTSIESRVNSLSRDLATLREKIRMAGPRYADMMRQLEVAETELQGITADISRTEVRYRRGEISAAAYHRLLEDSYRRRDRAQTTIDGVLLRLKEETS